MITKQTGVARQRATIVDRRLNHKQRERFDTAMKLLQPAMERSAPNDTTMYLVMQRLHTTYPELSVSEIEALLMSVIRALKKMDNPRLVVSN